MLFSFAPTPPTPTPPPTLAAGSISPLRSRFNSGARKCPARNCAKALRERPMKRKQVLLPAGGFSPTHLKKYAQVKLGPSSVIFKKYLKPHYLEWDWKIALKLYGTICHLPFHYYVADMSLPPDFLNLSDYLKQPVARCNPPKTRLHLVLLFLFKLKEV